MTHITLTEKQVRESVRGANYSTFVSLAVSKAHELAAKYYVNMTVVRTTKNCVRVYTDFQMRVAANTIAESIYSTDVGFLVENAT